MKITPSERAKLWRLNNPEKAKAIQERYVKRNPEKRKESFNNYWIKKREENPEKWKSMMRERAKEYRLDHIEEYKKMEKKKSRLRRERNLKEVQLYNKKYNRIKRLALYGLDEDKYQKMVLEQSGKCALCNQSFNTFHIDHCHKTLKVRGLLCGGCNMMLGLIEKRLEIKKDFIKEITKYLKH
jgi:hypothetical protein